MANKGHVIPIASDTRQFEQGVRSGIIKPLTDAEDKLEDLGKTRGPDQLERDLKKAQTETEQLKRDTKSTASAIEREYRDGYQGAKRAADEGLGGMRDKASEVGSELRQNLGETFSSFKGDLADLPQIAQDTLGGLAGSGALGGIAGLAATAAGAAGLGLISAAIQQQAEDAQKLRERLSSAYSEAAAAGRTYLDSAQIVVGVQDLIFNPDRAAEWKQVQEDANKLQLDGITLAKATTGDMTAQAVVQQRINELQDEQAQKVNGTSKISKQVHAAEQKDLDALEGRWNNLAQATREQATAADTAGRYTSEILKDAIRSAGQATEEVDKFGNELYTLPDGKQVLIDAKTGRATDDVSKFAGDLDGKIPTVKTTTIELDTRAAEQQAAGFIRRISSKKVTIDANVVYRASNGKALQ